MELPTARQPIEEQREEEEKEEAEEEEEGMVKNLRLWHLLYYYTPLGRTWYHLVEDRLSISMTS